jgi:hypothetical protein
MDITLKNWLIKVLIVFVLAVVFALFVYPGMYIVKDAQSDATAGSTILIEKINRVTGNAEVLSCHGIYGCSWEKGK